MSSIGLTDRIREALYVSLAVWAGLKIFDALALEASYLNLPPQAMATLGWVLWVNKMSLLSIDATDWILIIVIIGVLGYLAFSRARRSELDV